MIVFREWNWEGGKGRVFAKKKESEEGSSKKRKLERWNTEETRRQLGIGKVKEHWKGKIFKLVDEKNLRY